MLQRLSSRHPHAALKLAPATLADDPLLRTAELEWIGHRRQCQQLVAWFGTAAMSPGRRVATVLDDHGTAHSLTGEAPAPLVITSQIGQYVLEPHAAVLAAGLSAQLACRLGCRSAGSPGRRRGVGSDLDPR